MIQLISGESALRRLPHEFPLVDAMHRGRAQAFHTRLGWDVTVVDGWERDQFDDCNPLYIVAVSKETGVVQGALRLLPTTGPNMLRDVFPQLMELDCTACHGSGYQTRIMACSECSSLGVRRIIPRHPLVWESSRVFTTKLDDHDVLDELLAAISEIALLLGITHIVSVFDAVMYRILRRKIEIELIGRIQNVGGIRCYVGKFSLDSEAVKRGRIATGFVGSALVPVNIREERTCGG